jgi:hypothetical protein
MWQDHNGFHVHELLNEDIRFTSETEALAYGISLAHSWIDREL